MAFLLTDVIQAVLRELGELKVSFATGGSTTTVVDANEAGGQDQVWKGGTLVILYDAGGAGAAPEGEFFRITSYVANTGTFTVPTISAAVAANDRYGVTGPAYPLQQIIQSVNDALRSLGDIALVDTTTLDTIAGDTEYAASATWKRSRPLRVDVQGRTGDAQDNQWLTSYDWDFIPAAGGTSGKIIFQHYYAGTRDIRVTYQDKHPRVIGFSDVIHETFHPDLVVVASKVKVMEWKAGQTRDPEHIRKLNELRTELNNARALHPIWKPKRKPKLFTLRSVWEDEDDFTWPT